MKRHGFNELKKEQRLKAVKVFLRQFTNFIVWILVVAAGISYGIGEHINFWVISFIIVFIVFMGFIQEYKAERAVEALKEFVEPTTIAIRNGRPTIILSREVVPGDLLALEMGDKIPADAEVIEETALKADESTLTGESSPVSKEKKRNAVCRYADCSWTVSGFGQKNRNAHQARKHCLHDSAEGRANSASGSL